MTDPSTKTLEDIASEIAAFAWVDCVHGKDGISGPIHAYGKLCAQKAYEAGRAAEARALAAEQPKLDKPSKPTKLEHVARAIGDCGNFCDDATRARAAIEALKTHPAEFMYGGDFVEPWLLPSNINRYLNAILSETEGK